MNKKLITSLILFVLIFSVAAHAFVIGSYDYRIDGIISNGGPTLTTNGKLSVGSYESYLTIGQPIISYNVEQDNIYMTGGDEGEGYKLCLGIFCTGAFEKPFYVSITGYITYDTGLEVANSDANVIVKYGQEVYKGETVQTNEEGRFTGNVTIPDRITDKPFNIEVYAKGRVEAAYTCKYNQETKHCDSIN